MRFFSKTTVLNPATKSFSLKVIKVIPTSVGVTGPFTFTYGLENPNQIFGAIGQCILDNSTPLHVENTQIGFVSIVLEVRPTFKGVPMANFPSFHVGEPTPLSLAELRPKLTGLTSAQKQALVTQCVFGAVRQEVMVTKEGVPLVKKILSLSADGYWTNNVLLIFASEGPTLLKNKQGVMVKVKAKSWFNFRDLAQVSLTNLALLAGYLIYSLLYFL